MDELVGRLTTKAGIDAAVVERSIGIVSGALRSEGPSEKVQALINQIPGADAAIVASSSNGDLAYLMGDALLAAGTRLMALDLGIGETGEIARERRSYGRDKIGADQMSGIISGTPGLGRFA